MEEINLKDLLMYFVKKIPIILIVSVVAMVLGSVYSLVIKKPLYHGETTLILVQKDSTVTQNDVVLNQKLVSTYSVVVKSNRVLNRVIKELKLDYSVDKLYNSIAVSGVNNAEIIKIVVSDRDSENAAIIANKLADVFKEEIEEIYNMENVSILDMAEEQGSPYNINLMRDELIFFILGFVIIIGILFVIYYFDTSVKSSEEIEKRLDVPVIGTVPLYRKGK